MSAEIIEMPDKLAWLFGAAPGAQDGSLKDAKTLTQAWSILRENWQVLPVAGPRLLAWAAPSLRKSEAALALSDRLVSIRNFAQIQLQVCGRLVRALQAAGVPHVLLKGSAVRFTAYSDPTARCGKDIDLLTSRRFLRQAEQIAHEVGFVPSQWNAKDTRFRRADPVMRAKVESRHYELGFLVRRQVVSGLPEEDEAAIRRDLPTHYLWHETEDGRLACYVSTDIHHALSLDLPANGVLRTAETVETDFGPAPIPAPAWTVLHLIFKIYWEGVHTYNKGLYQYTDLVLQLRRMPEPQIADLLALLAEHRLEVAAYYVLRRIETDFGESLPSLLIDFLEEQALAPEGEEIDAMVLNDLGDMWPKLWGYR